MATNEVRGWVYIITNQAMPGLLKVGYSTKDPSLRAAELDHTGSPFPYVVAYDMLVTAPRSVEQRVHEIIKRHHAGKEWFKCVTAEAIAAIRTAAGAGKILESSSGKEPKPEPKPTRPKDAQPYFPFSFATTFRCWNCGEVSSDGVATCKTCGKRGPLAK